MRTTRRAAVGRMVAAHPFFFDSGGTSSELSCVCRKRSRAGRQEISFNGGGKSAKDAEKQRQDDICDEWFAFIPALAYYINRCPN